MDDAATKNATNQLGQDDDMVDAEREQHGVPLAKSKEHGEDVDRPADKLKPEGPVYIDLVADSTDFEHDSLTDRDSRSHSDTDSDFDSDADPEFESLIQKQLEAVDAVAKLESELKSVDEAIKRNKNEGVSLKQRVRTLCIKGRNDVVKDDIRNDFRQGLIE